MWLHSLLTAVFNCFVSFKKYAHCYHAWSFIYTHTIIYLPM